MKNLPCNMVLTTNLHSWRPFLIASLASNSRRVAARWAAAASPMAASSLASAVGPKVRSCLYQNLTYICLHHVYFTLFCGWHLESYSNLLLLCCHNHFWTTPAPPSASRSTRPRHLAPFNKIGCFKGWAFSKIRMADVLILFHGFDCMILTYTGINIW